MLNKSINFAIVSLIAGLLISNSVQAQPHQHSPSNPENSTKTMPQPMGDQHFLKMMVHHDQKTVKMADLALEKAKNPQIKTLASYIKIAQNQEIEQLQTVYKQLYGSEVPVAMMNCMGMGTGGMGRGRSQGMDMGGMMSLASLENAPNFDDEWLRRMIHHQQMSVNMASKTAENANSPQIRNLAQAIIKTQTTQLEKLQQLAKG